MSSNYYTSQCTHCDQLYIITGKYETFYSIETVGYIPLCDVCHEKVNANEISKETLIRKFLLNTIIKKHSLYYDLHQCHHCLRECNFINLRVTPLDGDRCWNLCRECFNYAKDGMIPKEDMIKQIGMIEGIRKEIRPKVE